MSSRVTALPRSGWWSWRFTPRMITRLPFTRSDRSRTSTDRKPVRTTTVSASRPSGSTRVTTTRCSTGVSADHTATRPGDHESTASCPLHT